MNGVTTQHHLETLINERTKLFENRVKALETATILAAGQMDKRLDGMNEFRDTLKDQGSTFATKVNLNAAVDKLEMEIGNNSKDMRDFRDFMKESQAKASQLSVILVGIGTIVGIFLSIISISLKLMGR
jgi:hypothetical protein